MVFGIFIGIAFIFLSLSVNLITSYFEAQKTKKSLKKMWGTLLHTQKKQGDTIDSLVSSFLVRKKYTPYDCYIDDGTWDNLDLQQIFSQINSTQTSLGGELLYSKMRLLKFSIDDDFENLKSYLLENEGVRERIQNVLAKLGKKNNNMAFQIVYGSGLKKVRYDRIYIMLGFLPALSLLAAFINNILGSLIFIFSVSFNIIFYVFRKYSLELELERMSYLVQIIHVSNVLKKLDFPGSSNLARDLNKFKILNFLGYAFNYKTDVSETSIIFEYINAIFMIPFIAYSQLNSKLFKYNDSIKEVLDIISNLDAAISNLNFLEYSIYHCKPIFSNEKGLKAKEIYHPLLKNPISNSIEFYNNIVISGDNASGKSTFMRTIAINCILAQSLNFALARSLLLSNGGVSSSINVSDNVMNGESHFVAEGKRIKILIEKLSPNKFNYLFLDEIFSGTNSAERVSIGTSLMNWLKNKNCLYMITTHDIELIKSGIEFNKNYYFTSSQITNKSDYKIREGISTTTNAIATLENLNYPNEIISESKLKLKEFVTI